MAYLDDVGDHPLFLAALQFWHDLGYLKPALAGEIRKRLVRPGGRALLTLEKFYPDMIKESWPREVALAGAGGCPRLSQTDKRKPLSVVLPE